MRFFTLLTTILFTVTLSRADTTITLRTSNVYHDYEFGSQYVAVVYGLSVPTKDYSIGGVETKNLQGLTNDNVKGLHVVHQFCKYLPNRIFDWFKNVNHFHVVRSELEFLGDEPLDGRIRYVHFDDNKIQVIPKNFFTSTGEIELISFERNRIETLDEGLFRGLGKLRWVSFAGNRIRSLPGTLFSTNINIECISFENNGLTRVGADLVKDLTKLIGVSFDGNVCINSAYWNDPKTREGLTGDFTTFCDGRCETIGELQTQIYEMKDKVGMMEQKYPKCSYMRDFFWDDEGDSNENDSNEDSGENRKSRKSMCPYARYNV